MPTRRSPDSNDVVKPFFFQAEDGIRDLYVTGVQTCALPISTSTWKRTTSSTPWPRPRARSRRAEELTEIALRRSEERRVGKECGSRWSAEEEIEDDDGPGGLSGRGSRLGWAAAARARGGDVG